MKSGSLNLLEPSWPVQDYFAFTLVNDLKASDVCIVAVCDWCVEIIHYKSLWSMEFLCKDRKIQFVP
jgi:hypothetical protein